MNRQEWNSGGKIHGLSSNSLSLNSLGFVRAIMRRGRARWKIENEALNTLKNHAITWNTTTDMASRTC